MELVNLEEKVNFGEDKVDFVAAIIRDAFEIVDNEFSYMKERCLSNITYGVNEEEYNYLHDLIRKAVLKFDDLEKFKNSNESLTIGLMLTSLFMTRFYEELYLDNLSIISIKSNSIDVIRHYKNKSKKEKRLIKNHYLSIDWYKKVNKKVDEAIKDSWDKCLERRDLIVEFISK